VITDSIRKNGKSPETAGQMTLEVTVLAGTFLSLVVFFWFAFIVGRQLTKTVVHISLERLVLKTVVYGREKVQKYNLSAKSYAKQHWVHETRPGPRRGGSYPRGIDVTSKRGTAHFGDALSRGELDWVECRINRFLGQATNAAAPRGATASPGAIVAPIEGLPDEPIAPPKGTKIGIEEDAFESRIYFPGTAAMGSYKGLDARQLLLFGFSACEGRSRDPGPVYGSVPVLIES